MKRSITALLTLTTVVLLSVAVANAQKIATGERAPDISVSEWLTAKPVNEIPYLIDFYHSASKEAGSLLSTLNGYARHYKERIAVIVIARESKDKVQQALTKDSPLYHAAIDDNGKTFAAFGVNVIPFGVLVDAKGKVLWFGNPAQLNNDILDKLLK